MRETFRSGALFFEAKKMLTWRGIQPGAGLRPLSDIHSFGQGGLITDVDGNDYIDYCLANGSLILGHARGR